MNKEALIRFIQDNKPIPSAVVAKIADVFKEITIAGNDYFLKEGRMSNEYLFLETGFMRSFTFDPDGNEITTNFYSPCQVVFEVSSFFSRTRSKESIRALTDCTGYTITFEELNKLFHTIPEFREFGRAMLVSGFVKLKQKTLSLINETAEERYTQLMGSNPEIFQHAPLKHIATYLGITDTSLSRIRREYQKK